MLLVICKGDMLSVVAKTKSCPAQLNSLQNYANTKKIAMIGDRQATKSGDYLTVTGRCAIIDGYKQNKSITRSAAELAFDRAP